MKKKFAFVFIAALSIMCANTGCVHNVPLSVDVEKDIATQIHVKNKIHAKVGVYLPENIKQYVYSQSKMGMTFQMDAGRYIEPISMKIISAIFSDVTIVNQLPPYNGDYTPDVEAVVKPEIVYCYGDAVGTISGFIEARFKMRITAYDLRGEILWQDEQMGESQSEPIDMLNTFLNGMQKVGETGYNAAFASAAKIINNFNNNPPKELYALLEIKELSEKGKELSDSELFENYFKKGKKLYSNKNYHHALYAFNKAEDLKPKDLASLFYSGVCYTYIAQRDNAVLKFDKILEIAPKSQEAKDSKKWINLKPLNIGIVLIDNTKLNKKETQRNIERVFKENKLYNLVEVNDIAPPYDSASDKSDFLDRATKKNIQVVIYIKINDNTISKSQQLFLASNKGDSATELKISVKADVFSTKKRRMYAQIPLEERDSYMKHKTNTQVESMKEEMIRRSMERLVFKLIENNTF